MAEVDPQSPEDAESFGQAIQGGEPPTRVGDDVAQLVVGTLETAVGAVQMAIDPFDPSGGAATMSAGVEGVNRAGGDLDQVAQDAWLQDKVRQHEAEHPNETQPHMGPISKDDEERSKQLAKDIEEIRRSLGETPEPHADPHVSRDPIPGGTPVPIFDPPPAE